MARHDRCGVECLDIRARAEGARGRARVANRLDIGSCYTSADDETDLALTSEQRKSATYGLRRKKPNAARLWFNACGLRTAVVYFDITWAK